jgi:hypothetical protein
MGQRTKYLACAMIAALVCTGRVAAGELSIACIHEVLSNGYALLLHCGEPPDNARQASYGRFRAQLQAYINQNAALGQKLGADRDSDIGQALARSPGLCEGEDYARLKRRFHELLEHRAQTRQRLTVPGDPSAGDCF